MFISESKRFSRYCENFVLLLFSPLIALVKLPSLYLAYIGFLTIIFLFLIEKHNNSIFAIVDWSSFIITWTIYPFSAYGVIHSAVPWVKHIRTFGIPGWRSCLETRKLFSLVGAWGGGWLLGSRSVINRPGGNKSIHESGFIDLWEFPSYALVMFIIHYWVNLDMFLAYGFWSLIICMGGGFLRTILPPSLLFLATSNHNSFELLTEVSEAIFPLKVATLLDRDIALTSDSGDLNESCIGEDFRTLDVGLWRDSANRLIDLSPIIMLDARSQSAPLIEEASWLLNSPHIAKTIFITQNVGERPFDGLVSMDDRSFERELPCIKSDNAVNRLEKRFKEIRSEKL